MPSPAEKISTASAGRLGGFPLNGQQTLNIHLLGIGGAGMSSLALHLQNEGHQVSGFDQKASSVTALLERRGIDV